MRPIDELSETLTVPEAARKLRIGRTLAYQLTARYLAGEPGGLPVIRLGGVLRVPRRALDELLNGVTVSRDDLEAAKHAAVDCLLEERESNAAGGSRPRPRGRRVARRGGRQLSLLEGR